MSRAIKDLDRLATKGDIVIVKEDIVAMKSDIVALKNDVVALKGDINKKFDELKYDLLNKVDYHDANSYWWLFVWCNHSCIISFEMISINFLDMKG